MCHGFPLKLFFCPACARVYYLPEESKYLCGRIHSAEVWADGRMRRFFISERTETNRPPWAIPELVEERELLNEDVTETWLGACEHPEDKEYGDVRRHFGYGAPGGRHLARDQVVGKYGMFVLRLAEI
jgi:hypothetical protein